MTYIIIVIILIYFIIMYIEEDHKFLLTCCFSDQRALHFLKSRMLLTLATGQLIVVLPDSVCMYLTGFKIETRILVCLCSSAFNSAAPVGLFLKKKMIILTK